MVMMNGQKFCLRWDSFRSSMTSVFEDLRQDEELVDITLCCDGEKIKAHRMMLSACSPYFRELLKENPCQHPVFFLKDTSIEDLRAVVEFVYKGEVNVAQAQLGSFIKTAEMLQVRGLSGEDEASQGAPSNTLPTQVKRSPATTTSPQPSPPAPRGAVRPLPPPDRPPSPPRKRRHRSGSPPVAPSDGCPPNSVSAVAVSGAEVEVKVECLDLEEQDCGLEAALDRVTGYETADQFPADVSLVEDSLGDAGPSGVGSGDRSMQGQTGLRGRTSTRRHSSCDHPLSDVDDVTTASPAAYVSTTLPAPATLPAGRPGCWVRDGGSAVFRVLDVNADKLIQLPTIQDVLNPSLNTEVFNRSVLKKLLDRQPLAKADWIMLVQNIYTYYKHLADHISGGWYKQMAACIIDEFPYLSMSAGTLETLDFIKLRLQYKFKNARRGSLKKAATTRAHERTRSDNQANTEPADKGVGVPESVEQGDEVSRAVDDVTPASRGVRACTTGQ